MQANNNLALIAMKKKIVQTKTQKPQITKRKTNYFKFVISEQFKSLVMFWLELVQFEVWMAHAQIENKAEKVTEMKFTESETE